MQTIGVHPMNLHLRLARLWPELFKGMAVDFVDYPEGRDTGRMISAGHFALGGTGSTPPLISQSEGLPVIYLAASAPRPANGALLVATDSDISGLSQLKGKRVALIDGSFHTYLLARSLEQVGLGLTDVVRCELSPAASRAALARGEVDVWIAMAPLIDQTIGSGEARLLSLCGSTIPNRSVFWTLQDAAAAPDELEGFVAGLIALGRAISADPDRAAALLAGEAGGAEARPAWNSVVRGRDWTVVPASAALVAEQQEEANVLHAHGDFAKPLKIEAFRPVVGAA